MATKKRGRPSSAQKKAQTAEKSNRQIYSVILFAVAVFLLFVVLIPGQSIWKALHRAMFGFFGVMAFLYPFLIGAVAIAYGADNISKKAKAKVKNEYNWTKIAQDTHFIYQKAICQTMAERQANQIAQEKARKEKKIKYAETEVNNLISFNKKRQAYA